jgi:beta-barrel assembly-enhancing protease
MDATRRHFLSHAAGCGCVLGLFGSRAFARETDPLEPLVSLQYEPKAADERGLWEQCDRLEKDIAISNLLIRDDKLTRYLYGVTERLLGEMVTHLRIYPVRNADFNASMFPNGMMLIHSGLLARVRNEAQLAAVIGHECGHYLRLHSIARWRDIKTKSAIAAFIAIAGAGASGATGTNWYDLASAIGSGLILSVFSFSRAQETEADTFGLKLLRKAGYTPHAASEVWSQLIEERKASAAARKKKYKDHAVSAVSTHPPSNERMTALKKSAAELEGKPATSTNQEDRRQEYAAIVAPMRQVLLDEQIKLNDPGASLYLVNSLAKDGWDGVLRYNEGEVYRLRDESGDAELAAKSYAMAVGHVDAPPEAHRAHGYALTKSGNKDQGRAALVRYLELKPNAADASMVRFSIEQQ